jgi:ABC-2 type transport system ATP-binding protein
LRNQVRNKCAVCAGGGELIALLYVWTGIAFAMLACPMTTAVSITTSALTRTYGSRRGVSDINLAIPAGSLYGFLGPNGAGKTTTIRVLLGFLRASSGSARILDMDCWRDSHRIKAEVGAIPGDLRLWPWLTGKSALKLFGRIRGRDIITRGHELAEVLELDLSVKVRQMSRGMRQKLGLILCMAHDPRVLILDEPTTALDPLMQERLRQLLRQRAEAGATVFFSSHTLAEVEELCERVAIVKQGQIVADSTVTQLRSQAVHEVTIVWTPGGTPEQVPACLKLSKQTAEVWKGTLASEGQANMRELLAFAANQPIADITIAKPDLEAIFMRYYDE